MKEAAQDAEQQQASKRVREEAEAAAVASCAAPEAAKAEAEGPEHKAGKKKKRKKKKRKRRRGRDGGAGEEGDASGDDAVDEEERRREQREAEAWLDGLAVEDVIRAELFEDARVEELRAAFQAGSPFKHSVIEALVEPDFLRRVREEMQSLEYFRKRNDLYDFVQTEDLETVRREHRPLLWKLREVLYSARFRELLARVTGVELSEKTSTFAAVYQDTHHLLCHDDELEGRRVAFILYLVPEDWGAADGGALELFGADENLEPAAVEKCIVPAWNSFAFFEVSPVSHHQVAEVLAPTKLRCSISGWFYGAPIPGRPPVRELPAPTAAPLPLDGGAGEWVDRQYRRKSVAAKVRKQFLDESSIELHQFLRRESFDSLLAAVAELRDNADLWRMTGPPNKRHYEVLDPEAAGGAVLGLHRYMRSAAFATVLGDLTGLEVREVHCEVRRFRPGCYTLGYDTDPETQQTGVDAVVCVIPPRPSWSREYGGTVHYAEEGDKEELIEVVPQSNTLSLVYRGEPGTMRFVKYVNHHAPADRVDFCCIFRVEDEDESSSGSGSDSDESGSDEA